MKVTVKTLKGEKFPIDVEASATVEQVKTTIESTKSEMIAANLKLIHSGKVLRDADTLETVGVKENDFLVVMVTKPKKAAAAAPAAAVPAPAAAETPKTPAPAAAAPAAATTTPAPAAAPADAPAAPARAQPEFPDEVVANLVALGFPETEVRHCLRASQGNPNVAVEFLTNGIPPSISAAAESSSSGGASGGGAPLQALRSHPQFNDLRRLVQSNPAMLQQVLTQIGQQQPELLREINSNQAAFLALMNEPIEGEAAASGGASGATSSSSVPPSPPALPPGGGDPAQMAQMMQNMDPGQLQMMATMMGLTPEQVQAVGRMIGQLPPEQLQEYMAQAMDSSGGGGGGGAPGGPQVLRLTEEEMAAVDRLAEMGFDRAEAAQAFLACDKNEALAANLLMDGGFGAMDMDQGGGGGGGGGGADNNNDDEDMYS